MKYIDTFFKIPVRIYEGADFKRDEILDKELPPVTPKIGVKRLRHDDIVGWQDMAFREAPQYDKEGNLLTDAFPCTVVHTQTHDILCHWPRKKFEQELELYVEKYEKWAEEMAKDALAERLKNMLVIQHPETDAELPPDHSS